MIWTDEALTRMKALWLGGKSASEIAAMIGSGCTRGVVVGHAYRRGWNREAPAKVGCPQTIWSQSMIAHLRHLVSERAARSRIAEAMNLTYDQVVSKIRKLGLDAPDARRYGGQASRAGARASFRREAASTGAPATPRCEVPDEGVTGLTVLQLPARGACRWPISGAGADMVHCGQSCGDAVYCDPCARKAYLAPVMSPARSQRNLERGVRKYA